MGCHCSLAGNHSCGATDSAQSRLRPSLDNPEDKKSEQELMPGYTDEQLPPETRGNIKPKASISDAKSNVKPMHVSVYR